MNLSRITSRAMNGSQRAWLKAAVAKAGFTKSPTVEGICGPYVRYFKVGYGTVYGLLNAARASGIRFVPV